MGGSTGLGFKIDGSGFGLVLDKSKAEFVETDPKNTAKLASFRALHLTRFDFGDLAGPKPPYAESPDAKTRVIDEVKVIGLADGLYGTESWQPCYGRTIGWESESSSAWSTANRAGKVECPALSEIARVSRFACHTCIRCELWIGWLCVGGTSLYRILCQ